MSEKDRRKIRLRLRPEQIDDPQWLLEHLPELLMQQYNQPETPEEEELPFDPSVDAFSNQVAEQLIADAPQVIGQAREERDAVSGDDEARIKKMVDARIALLKTIQDRVNSIGLSAEVTDKDVVRE